MGIEELKGMMLAMIKTMIEVKEQINVNNEDMKNEISKNIISVEHLKKEYFDIGNPGKLFTKFKF